MTMGEGLAYESRSADLDQTKLFLVVGLFFSELFISAVEFAVIVARIIACSSKMSALSPLLLGCPPALAVGWFDSEQAFVFFSLIHGMCVPFRPKFSSTNFKEKLTLRCLHICARCFRHSGNQSQRCEPGGIT